MLPFPREKVGYPLAFGVDKTWSHLALLFSAVAFYITRRFSGFDPYIVWVYQERFTIHGYDLIIFHSRCGQISFMLINRGGG